MKINSAMALVFMGISISVITGCVSTGQQGVTSDEPVKSGDLFSGYMKAAVLYGNQKKPLDALEAYTLAQTVKPEDPAARKGRLQMEAAVTNQSRIEYNQGLGLWKKGNFKAARERFLTALRLRPDYPESLAMLKQNNRIQASRFILHTIQSGDSLSKLSKKYYGSFDHFYIIAAYNTIENAMQIRLGQKIKIPEIDGLPFKKETHALQVVSPASGMPGAVVPISVNQAVDNETGIGDVVEQTEIYRDQGLFLFKQGEYSEAAFEFLKVLNSKPDDMETRQYLSECYFEQGSALLNQKDLVGASAKLKKALVYMPDCTKCVDAFRESENRTKELHYTRGITFFDQEKPKEAIAAWRRVEAMDPGYKQVLDHIKKAETILKNLAKIRQPE